jgi:hypothetical protein
MNAFAELRASPKLTEEFQGDAATFLRMLRQADEQERADPAKDVFSRFRFRPELPYSPAAKSDNRHPMVRGAIRTRTEHQTRTGHMPFFMK